VYIGIWVFELWALCCLHYQALLPLKRETVCPSLHSPPPNARSHPRKQQALLSHCHHHQYQLRYFNCRSHHLQEQHKVAICAAPYVQFRVCRLSSSCPLYVHRSCVLYAGLTWISDSSFSDLACNFCLFPSIVLNMKQTAGNIDYFKMSPVSVVAKKHKCTSNFPLPLLQNFDFLSCYSFGCSYCFLWLCIIHHTAFSLFFFSSCICLYIYIYIYVCVCVCVCLCVCVCVCVTPFRRLFVISKSVLKYTD